MKHLVALGLALSLSACAVERPSPGNRKPVDVAHLEGRLFLVALDGKELPEQGMPLPEQLYVMPADAAAPPERIGDFANTSGLVGYPARHALGLNSTSGEARGSYLVDTGPGDAYHATRMVDANAPGLFTARGWRPKESYEPERRVLPTQVTFSPDGTLLAGVETGGHVCVAAVDGQGMPVCTANVIGCQTRYPTWSPDGKAIAFAGRIDGDLTSCNLHEIYVMDVATGVTRQLTDIRGRRLKREMRHAIVKPDDPTDRWHGTDHPIWSPDGQWIAFSSHQGIGKIHPDGSGLTIIGRGMNPSWSPEGTMLAYLAPRTGSGTGGRRASCRCAAIGVYVMRADGSGAALVTTNISSSLTVMDVVWTD